MPKYDILNRITSLEAKMMQFENRLLVCESHHRSVKMVPRTMLQTAEAAAYLGIESSTLRMMARRHEIPYSKPGGKLLYFDVKDLNQWLHTNK